MVALTLFPSSSLLFPLKNTHIHKKRPTMVLYSCTITPLPCCKITSPNFTSTLPQRSINISRKPTSSSTCNTVVQKAVTLATAVILLWSTPAKAGLMSGISGIESVPGPELPQIEFLNRFNEENQKKYAENDARFKSSPLLKKLLEQSKINKLKNEREIQDKYCLRGAEWGVGDCSAAAMTPEEREKFIEMLRQKVESK